MQQGHLGKLMDLAEMAEAEAAVVVPLGMGLCPRPFL